MCVSICCLIKKNVKMTEQLHMTVLTEFSNCTEINNLTIYYEAKCVHT